MTTIAPPPLQTYSPLVAGLDPDHMIVLRNGRFDDTDRNQLDALFERAAKATSESVVIHFHGGLVSKSHGLDIAHRLGATYTAAGAYPAFVIWESGLREVIRNSLPEILQESVFTLLFSYLRHAVQQRLGPAAAAAESDGTAQLRELMGLDAVVMTRAESDAFAASLDDDIELRTFEHAVATESQATVTEGMSGALGASAATFTPAVRVRASAHTMMSPDVVGDIRSERAEASAAGIGFSRIALGGARALAQVLLRFYRGRAHGFHATIVEELLREFYAANAAQIVWHQMKQDTDDAFDGPGDLHGGTALVENLVQLFARRPDRRVVLVGHSTGAVYICNLLRHLDAAVRAHEATARAQVDVVLLAPACTSSLFDATLRDHGSRIRRLRIFSMRDEAELADHVIRTDDPRLNEYCALLYPSSLLYFVSGVCERVADTALLGMQRFVADLEPFDSTATFPELARIRAFLGVAGRVVWSPTHGGAAGMESDSLSHGDFDDDEVTLRSVQAFIAAPHVETVARSIEGSLPETSGGAPRVSGHRGRPVRPTADASSEDFTGRLIVRFDPDDFKRVASELRDAVGVRADVTDEAEAVAASFGPESGVILPRLGIAVVSIGDWRARARLTGAAGATVRAVARERWAYAATAPATVSAWSAPQPWAEPSSAWHVCATGADRSSFRGRGVRIGLIDSGLDRDHPHFQGRTGDTECESFLPGRDATDEFGHGTHCAGIAAGSLAPASDVGRYGIAPDAHLYMARALDQSGRGSEAAVLAAIGGAREHRCDIVSISLVLSTADSDADAIMMDVLNESADNGIMFVGASGNDSLNPYHLLPVRRLASYLAVSSVGAVNRQGNVEVFSNGGATGEEVSFLSCGGNVLSAWHRFPHWRVLSGTSMAAPVVAGVAALWAEKTGSRGSELRNLVRATSLPCCSSFFPVAP